VKTSNIPALVAIKVQPYGGEYTKRKMKAENLYCWFNEAQADHPHVSIDCSYLNDPWKYFHVTFPCYKLDVGKSSKDEEVLERVSYSIHFVIDNERDVVEFDPKAKAPSTTHWQAPKKVLGNDWVSSKGRADMGRSGLAFAKEFFASAFFQSLA